MWHAGSLGTSTFLICLLVGLLALTCASAVSLTANKPPTEDKLILHLFCIFLCHLDCSSLSWCGEVGWAKQASKHCLEYCFGHLCWERRAWKGMLCLIQYQRKLRQGRKRKGLPMYLVLACRNFRGYHLLLKWFNYPSKQCHSMRWHASSSSSCPQKTSARLLVYVYQCLSAFCLWLVSGACKRIFDACDRPRCWPSAWRTQECPACTGLQLCILHWVLEFCRFISRGAFSTCFDEVMDVVSYNTLIKAYVRHNLFDTACGLLPTMRLAPSSSKICSWLLQ